MITFLRKVRKTLIEPGSVRKYILYAIGEIALVVIGILIALQINNWNENRKDRKQELIYLRRLLNEVPDSLGWSTAIEISAVRANEGKVNLDQLNARDILDTARFINRAFTIGNPILRNPYIPTYEELVSSGKLSILESDSLKTELKRYMEIFDWWEKSGNYQEWQSHFNAYRDHIHQYFSPMIMNHIANANNDVIPLDVLKSLGLDVDGYMSDESSVYHLRKIIAVHEQLSIMYQLTQEGRLLPLVERIRRAVH